MTRTVAVRLGDGEIVRGSAMSVGADGRVNVIVHGSWLKVGNYPWATIIEAIKDKEPLDREEAN